jgi:hypothetical protein
MTVFLRACQCILGIVAVGLLVCEVAGFFMPVSGFATIAKNLDGVGLTSAIAFVTVELGIQNKRLRERLK